jgi:hypothetical protein
LFLEESKKWGIFFLGKRILVEDLITVFKNQNSYNVDVYTFPQGTRD